MRSFTTLLVVLVLGTFSVNDAQALNLKKSLKNVKAKIDTVGENIQDGLSKGIPNAINNITDAQVKAFGLAPIQRPEPAPAKKPAAKPAPATDAKK
jgi:hypothetical protein